MILAEVSIMNIAQLKKLFLTTFDSIDQEKYVVDPKSDLIRQKKLGFKDTLLYILSMGGGTILSELSQLTGDIVGSSFLFHGRAPPIPLKE